MSRYVSGRPKPPAFVTRNMSAPIARESGIPGAVSASKRETGCRTTFVDENQRQMAVSSSVAIANVDADIVKLRDAPTKVAVQELVVTSTLQHRHYTVGLRVW